MPVVTLSPRRRLNGIGDQEEKDSMDDDLYLSEDYSSYDKTEKYERKINNRIRELRISERKYVAQLDKLMRFFNAFRETSYVLSTDKDLKGSKDEIHLKIHAMQVFHRKFLTKLELLKNDLSLLASIFFGHKADFEMYLNYEEINNNYSALSKNVQPDEGDLAHQENMLLLSEPNRKLPMYVALLSELLKYNVKYQRHVQANRGTADLKSIKNEPELKAAIDSVKWTLDKINISRRIGEINGCDISLHEQGFLIRCDEFKITKDKTRFQTPQICILFEKVLIVTKVMEDQKESKKKLDFVDLVYFADEAIGVSLSDKTTALTVWCNEEANKRFTMKADPNIMNDWIYELRQILNERFI